MQDQRAYPAGRRASRHASRALPPDGRPFDRPLPPEEHIPVGHRMPVDGHVQAPPRRSRSRRGAEPGFDNTGPGLYAPPGPPPPPPGPPPRRPVEEPPPPADAPPRSHRRKDKGGGSAARMRVLAWISVVLTVLMVIVTLGGYTLYRSALSKFRTEDVKGKLGDNRPVNATGALNVLLVGSDTREGENIKYGLKMQNAGKRTDTMILMHISPNRDTATLVSFPRDSIVQLPACVRDNGTEIPPRVGQINSAYNDGGIACTIRTLESLTRIRIDHFVEVDFTGFKNIVDALGGIQVCLRQPVDDKKAKLKLPAGWQTLRGEAALGYVRLRNYGDGSDIQRIKRQQIFLTQVVKKATSSDLLSNPGKLYNFITAAASSVKMDPELANNTETLVQIAQSARSLTASGVKFITVPWEPHPEDENRVIWKQPEADNLFSMIRSDIEVKPTATPTPSGPSAKPVIKPADVRIQVLNGTSVPGRAKTVADALVAQGFTVVGVGNAPLPGADRPQTMVLYGKNAENGADYAAPVAAKLINKVTPQAGKIKPTSTEPYVPEETATPAPDASAKPAQTPKTPIIQLVIGSDWEGVKAPVKIPESLKSNVVDNKTDPCQ